MKDTRFLCIIKFPQYVFIFIPKSQIDLCWRTSLSISMLQTENLSHKRHMICLKNVLWEKAELGTNPNSVVFFFFYSVLSTEPQSSYSLLVILQFLTLKVLPNLPFFSKNITRITFLATSPTVLVYISCERSN